MILERAIFAIKPGEAKAFEAAFALIAFDVDEDLHKGVLHHVLGLIPALHITQANAQQLWRQPVVEAGLRGAVLLFALVDDGVELGH